MDMTATWYASAAAAWGCYAFGIWTFRLSRGEPLFLAVAKMALVACPVILSCFGIHATRRYQVILATASIPIVEVASGDNGRERTIERINCPEGTIIERERIGGWRVVSADGPRLAASGAVLQRTQSGAAIDAPGSHCECPIAGCPECLLEVPGCGCGCYAGPAATAELHSGNLPADRITRQVY